MSKQTVVGLILVFVGFLLFGGSIGFIFSGSLGFIENLPFVGFLFSYGLGLLLIAIGGIILFFRLIKWALS